MEVGLQKSCEGLKTLVLERGRMLSHPKTTPRLIWITGIFPSGDKITNEIKKNQPKQSRTGYVNTESTKHMFVDDLKHPYNEDKPLVDKRGYHVGGRSLTWGRQSHRLTKFDFEGNAKEGIAVIGQLGMMIWLRGMITLKNILVSVEKI